MPLVPIRQFKSPRISAAAQVSQLVVSPAPVGGINYRDPISNMPVTDALVLRNFIPKQTGAELRKGWQYVTTETLAHPIKSMFAYNAASPAGNKLFVASNGRIYEVTGSTFTSVAVTTSTDDLWYTTQFANGSNVWLLAVSPTGGYWTYNGTTWTQQTVTNLPTSGVNSVAVWKNRVWFTVSGRSQVFYLTTVDAITGTAASFEMGSVLRNGGFVRGLVNWTLDGGVGIDDYLIVVGSQGDVGVWQGTDPSSASTFGLKGVWYVGPVPVFGKFFTSFGGDVMILSELGLVPMARLVNGQFSELQPGPAAKIQSVLSPVVARYRGDASWDVYTVPSSDVLVIKTPPLDGTYTQYAMNINTGAWSTLNGMPIACCTVLNGQHYFATDDKRVAKGYTGELDDVAVDGTGGTAIDGEVQTSFNAFDRPGVLKRFTMVRPVFIARQPPSLKAKINTQYAMSGVAGAPSFSFLDRAEWDEDNWNVARWGSSSNTFEVWIGVTGLGYYGALRMRVRGLGGTTTFASFHIMTEFGGVM